MVFRWKPIGPRLHKSDVFGHIEGAPVGSTFESRLYLHHAGVHSGVMKGIDGKGEGCYSVVMSGEYEDDKDEGYRFIYTGCGGRDTTEGEKPRDGPQTCDQDFNNPLNASLRRSAETRKPVRVTRGYKIRSNFAPDEGYRYDGLYVVEQAWMDTGKSGFKVCKFLLVRLPDQPPIPLRIGAPVEWTEEPRHFNHITIPSTCNDFKNARKNSTDLSKPRRRRTIDQHAQPSTSTSIVRAPRQQPYKQPPHAIEPIPPTTNIVCARRPQREVSQAQPALVDVASLLAEMSSKPQYLKPSTSTFAAPSASSCLQHGNDDSRRRPMVGISAAPGRPDVKREIASSSSTHLPAKQAPTPACQRDSSVDSELGELCYPDSDNESLMEWVSQR